MPRGTTPLETMQAAGARRWAGLMFSGVLAQWSADLQGLRRNGLDRPSFRRGPEFAILPGADTVRARSIALFLGPRAG